MSATKESSVISFLQDASTTVANTPTTNCTVWSGTYHYSWAPQYWYTEDKATVAFRVVKKLIDLKIVNEDKLTIKKFVNLVDELVKTL